MPSLARATRIEETRNNHAFGGNGHAGATVRALSSPERIGFSKFYPRNALLFLEGETAHGAYILRSGLVKISISSADGKKLIMRIARPGDVLGLYAGLTGHAYEATAEMLRDGRLEFVSRDGLLDLMKDRRPPALDLVQVLSKQFTEFVDHARLLMLSGSAVEKLARLILMWGRDFGERTSEGVQVQILLTQEEIAQIIGASRETVTRLLSSLKRRKIIHVNGHGMIIRNSAALASLAQLSP
jgi:CRP/FNR family transcriptional regulator, cyclic AMP receptor protein